MSTIRYADQNLTEIELAQVPEVVPVVPLRNAVILPGVLLPVFVGRTESIQLIEAEGQPGALIGLFTQKSASDEDVDVSGLYRIGTLAEVHRVMPVGEGGYQVFLQGVQKIELVRQVEGKPYLQAKISPLGEIADATEEAQKIFQSHVLEFIKIHPGIPDEVAAFVKRLKNPASLANQVVFFSRMEIEEKIDFMKFSSVQEKIDYVQKWLLDETQSLRMEQEVRERVEQDTSRMQREFYLRKQMEQIRKELGEDESDDTDDLEKTLREKQLPEHVQKAVDKELKRFRRLNDSPQSGGMEAGQIRSWLELVAELPWEEPEKKVIHLKSAAQLLDQDHEGLEEVKKQILEYLAVEKQTGGSRAPILCLVGPPGVGKTSLAHSIAKSMDRPLVRAALGGVRDEAEIRGHRRTYVGALPGKILSAMKKAEQRNPVFLLDEIDKTGISYHGDPAAALLEVLDPEQNHTFEDHYLGLPYDLSQVLFICTANQLDTIPLPLQDRMEVVPLSGYTLEEKKAIARKHLLPDILSQLKLPAQTIDLSAEALEAVITGYTREAGVRSLKRKLEAIARKTIRRFLEKNEDESQEPLSGTEELRCHYEKSDIKELLGRIRYQRDSGEEVHQAGVAIGLAWTPVGGDILYIEATRYPGKGELKLSGQLGDVMKESAVAAYSWIKSHARDLGIAHADFQTYDIHLHIPSGAIPKDGPSAGVTLLTAITSLYSGHLVERNLAMTGEISLRGRILPVGGIKEKVLAAQAAGITTVLLPEKNRPDFEEIPEHIRSGITVEYFEDMLTLVKRAVKVQGRTRPDRDGW
ncbi:MAG: endopeptidase La [Spirochaetales bacterium]|nr:endopeptidase La [Spirochaetales bacterium]